MSDTRPPRGAEWDAAVDALFRFSTVMSARAQYPEGHPMIVRAIEAAGEGFGGILGRIRELVVALTDGELVVCGRPMPGLRARMTILAAALEREKVECLIFQDGVLPRECDRLARAFIGEGRVREIASTELAHILVRFAEIRTRDRLHDAGSQAAAFVPSVQGVLDHVVDAFSRDASADVNEIRAIARRLVAACSANGFVLPPRCYVPGNDDQAPHAANVAMMAASLALAANVPDETVVDLAAAALVHDVGTLLSPETVRGIPEPALEEGHRRTFRQHPIIGAWALLATGCPPLWLAVALEHHRGVDGGGYPQLEKRGIPSTLVRMVALSSFFDRKRTLLGGLIAEPEETLTQAARLEASYFGPPLVAHFLRAFGVYPPGTIVELSSGEAALVTHPSPADPVRPQVEIISGPRDGTRVDLAHRDLLEGRHTLSIARAILPPLAVCADTGAGSFEVTEPEVTAPEVTAPALAAPTPPTSPVSPASPAPPSEDALLGALGGEGAVPVMGNGGATDHRAAFILSFVDGMTPIETLLDITGLPRREVLETLHALVATGAITTR